MPKNKKTTKKSSPNPNPTPEQERKVCFVISPIGKKGTEQYARFKEVLDFVIRNAVRNSGYDIEVIRADDIQRPGSFIKDILESLYTSFLVIADLTNQNPNVFYELGVRHSLRPRTILIAQSLEDIPSDLREYRSIVYDTSAKGASEFSDQLKTYLSQIYKDPERFDNPVLDRIGGISENRIAQLEIENQNLKNELSNLLKKGVNKSDKPADTNIYPRFRRIASLVNLNVQNVIGTFRRGEKSYRLPARQGNFNLYFMEDGEKIKGFWYVSIRPEHFNSEDELADIRVLMGKCVEQGGTYCTFVIATENDLSAESKNINKIFNKMKSKLPSSQRQKYELQIWDAEGITVVEKELGLKI